MAQDICAIRYLVLGVSGDREWRRPYRARHIFAGVLPWFVHGAPVTRRFRSVGNAADADKVRLDANAGRIATNGEHYASNGHLPCKRNACARY